MEVYTPPPPTLSPPKKNSLRFNKALDTCCAPRVFQHFKFLFMQSWMLFAHSLYRIQIIEYRIQNILIQNILQELIISYLTGNKSLEINFPVIALNDTLMTVSGKQPRGKLPPGQGQGLAYDQRQNQGWGAIFLGGNFPRTLNDNNFP